MKKKAVIKLIYGSLVTVTAASILSVPAYAEAVENETDISVNEGFESYSFEETEEQAAPENEENTTAALEEESSAEAFEKNAMEEAPESLTESSPGEEQEDNNNTGSTDSLQASPFGNIYIDLNDDAETSEEDHELFKNLIENYRLKDHNGQEISGELTRILYGPLTSSKQITAPEYTNYYLNNAGQTTPVRNQGLFGTCWAFSTVASLESAILKERQRPEGGDVDAPASGEPILEGLENGVDISEKYFSWLAYSHGIKDGAQDEGITTGREKSDILNAGGLLGIPDAYFTAWRGIVDESKEPYRADNAPESFIAYLTDTTSDGLPERWSISENVYPVGDTNAPARVNKTLTLPAPAIIEYKDGKNVWTGYDSGATDLIKRTLTQTGAVAISYSADQSLASDSGNRDYFNNTTWSQYNDSNEVTVNHSVAIVGWNDDYPAENFKAEKNSLPPGNGAWLVKNSWGSDDLYRTKYKSSYTDYISGLNDTDKKNISWGIPGDSGVGTGFFWLSYYDKSISSAMAFGADIPDDGWDHDRIYQYNFYSDMANIPLVLRMYDTETEVANVFTAGENEYLDAVSVRTTEHDSHVNVKVYLLDDDTYNDDPVSGELVSSLETDIELAGFTTLKLSEPVKLKPGQRFAVVENIVSDGGYNKNQVSFLNVETVLSEDVQSDDNMRSVRAYLYSEAGQTFARVLKNGAYTWMSPESLTNELGGGIFTFGNALIKAFTVLANEPDKEEEQKQDDPVKENIVARQPEAQQINEGNEKTEEADKDEGIRASEKNISSSDKKICSSDFVGVQSFAAHRTNTGEGKAISITSAATGDDTSFFMSVIPAGAAVMLLAYAIIRKRKKLL